MVQVAHLHLLAFGTVSETVPELVFELSPQGGEHKVFPCCGRSWRHRAQAHIGHYGGSSQHRALRGQVAGWRNR